MTDPIADMLTRIRNASQALLPEVEVRHSKLKENVARVLKQEGYWPIFREGESSQAKLRLKLKYQGARGHRGPAAVSRPGLRRYVGTSEDSARPAVWAWPSSPPRAGS
jgi:small subunit ribosomal protein S8